MNALPPPPGPHPSPEALRRARSGPRDQKAERILAHAALCARCAEEEYRLDAFDRPAGVSEREIDDAWRRFSGEAPRRVPVWRPLALAATLLLAVGAVLVVRHRPRPDVVRGGAPLPALESPVGLLAEPPAEFRFVPASGASLPVRVFDAAHTYDWTSAPSEGGRVAFPPEERAKLRPGVDYFWTLLGGDAAAKSFRIRP